MDTSAPLIGINAVFCIREQGANSSPHVPDGEAGRLRQAFNDVSLGWTGNQFI